MDLELTGSRVLITAGAGGIGLEIARAFVREGAHVHVCDVDQNALAAIAVSDHAANATSQTERRLLRWSSLLLPLWGDWTFS